MKTLTKTLMKTQKRVKEKKERGKAKEEHEVQEVDEEVVVEVEDGGRIVVDVQEVLMEEEEVDGGVMEARA
jgi:hypothetical protein